ncbi:MAG: hypothetical protein FJ088_02005, partial [Deltaproteobacteria bacterium]|nr:hypothetical protein [Deltaproteobacteria bacterium]
MIPEPNLDDRKFDDIVEEAIRLIPQYCPDWTNFNKSDPGITLIELFAWMTEMVIYRLNKVPEKNYISFLNLLGVKLKKPQPARTVLTFAISEKGDQVVIPRGTTSSTKPSPEGNVISFETENDILVIVNKIRKCFTQTRVLSGGSVHDMFDDRTNHLNGELPGGFDAFGGATSVERILYIGDKRLKDFIENSILSVHFDCPNPGERELTKMLEWEYFDGARWMSLGTGAIELEFNAIALNAPNEIVKTAVNEIESFWIRGKLSDLPSSPEETIIDTIKGRLEVLEEGIFPDSVIVHTPDDIFTSLDLNKNFNLFGKEPSSDTTVYIKSDRILSHKNATFKIEASPVEGATAEKAAPTENIILRWEYYNGKRWRLIGRTGGGMKDVKNPEDTVSDRTNSFSEEGDVSFLIPSDIEPCEINGVSGYFVRCRIEQGDYGVPGQYELVEDKWIWKDERPLKPPVLKSLTIKYQEPFKPFEHIFVYNDFSHTDFSEMARLDHKPFQPFQPVQDSSPTMFIGFEKEFPNSEVRLFFSVIEKGRGSQVAGRAEKPAAPMPEQTVAFEYFNGKTWQNLFSRDETRNFTQSGFLIFTGPKDMRKGRLFGENLFWIRAR